MPASRRFRIVTFRVAPRAVIRLPDETNGNPSRVQVYVMSAGLALAATVTTNGSPSRPLNTFEIKLLKMGLSAEIRKV